MIKKRVLFFVLIVLLFAVLIFLLFSNQILLFLNPPSPLIYKPTTISELITLIKQNPENFTMITSLQADEIEIQAAEMLGNYFNIQNFKNDAEVSFEDENLIAIGKSSTNWIIKGLVDSTIFSEKTSFIKLFMTSGPNLLITAHYSEDIKTAADLLISLTENPAVSNKLNFPYIFIEDGVIQDYEYIGCVSKSDSNYYKKGVLVISEELNFTDECSDENNIVEYLCQDKQISIELHYCENGCKDGACIRAVDLNKNGEVEFNEFLISVPELIKGKIEDFSEVVREEKETE